MLGYKADRRRIGWAHLAAVGAETRAAVAPWLLPMAYLNLRIWRHETPLDPEHPAVLADHCVPRAEIIHEGLVDALRTLIVPGFKELGMKTAPIEAWLEAGASTEKPPTEFTSR